VKTADEEGGAVRVSTVMECHEPKYLEFKGDSEDEDHEKALE